jgi:hypothetical protein
VRRAESKLRADVIGNYPPDMPAWFSCVRFFHEEHVRIEGRATVQIAGETVPAEFVSKANGSFILDYEHGVPCHADLAYRGYLRLKPRTPDKVVIDYKYRVFADRIAPSE